MAAEDKKDVTRYLPNLWHSLVQVIIQSRLGEKACTSSKSPVKGSSMFTLEINGDEEVTQSIKKYMGNQTLTGDNPFSIEILLQTRDGDVMVLEVWTLSIEDNVDSPSQKICQLVTDRMSVLLKSAICISRITPAYGLSFRQGFETFIILYKLYTGKPDHSHLGQNWERVRVGQANIQSAFLSIHLAYRTELVFPPSKQNLPHDQMMVKSDHFKADSSPKHRCQMIERATDSSDTVPTSDESQEAVGLPFNSPLELYAASPRSRTSSESSNRGPLYTPSERIFLPFANYRAPSLEELVMSDDIPFSNLLVSVTEKKDEPALGTREANEGKPRISKIKSNYKITKTGRIMDEPQMNTSTHSTHSFASNPTKDENEYVLVNLKTPFVGTGAGDSELSTFFKEWQAAPPLRMFSEGNNEQPLPSKDVVIENSLCLNEQIKCFEDCIGEYDDLVKSLHLDDHHSQELG